MQFSHSEQLFRNRAAILPWQFLLHRAPPQKEWDSSKKEKGDKTKIEIEDEWDDDGNLTRTITKKTTTPDWKFKTEKTVETYSAAEAAKLGLGRK